MRDMKYILALDQGTTSSRAILFSGDLEPVAQAQKEIRQIYPADGFVEHDPEEIWTSILEVAQMAISRSAVAMQDIAAIGLTNQRETTIIWDRKSGRPLHNAIVWQDRRTADLCTRLKANGHEALIRDKTGLLLDPYFSATKIKYILDHCEDAHDRARRGELAFGTVDSFLIWRLTGGAVHATDATNASRTMLYDIHRGIWDETLLDLFNIPLSLMPEIYDCAADFGKTKSKFFGAEVPLRGVAGDQHAATLGQACMAPGMMKATFGTGAFALLNTGTHAIASKANLLTTVAYQLNGQRTYALEGSIFIAGAALQWLRDELKLLDSASSADAMARQADPSQAVYLVPAFVGLGAPYWDAHARGAIFGLTRNSGPNEFVKAALESVCFQMHDLLKAMQQDGALPSPSALRLRVDGGMAASAWTMQCLADLLDTSVDCPAVLETTARGAAYLAGLACGLCAQPEDFMKQWRCDKQFLPHMTALQRQEKISGWDQALKRTLSGI